MVQADRVWQAGEGARAIENRPHPRHAFIRRSEFMGFSAVSLAPLALILSGAGTADPISDVAAEPGPVWGAHGSDVDDANAPPRQRAVPAERELPSLQVPPGRVFRRLAESFRTSAAHQVRIEQRMTIRISPRPSPVQPGLAFDMPEDEGGPRFAERKIGKCLPISGISGVQPDRGRRVILYMRDERVITAQLERACHARDFYSGFYMARSPDGKLCVDRDILLSRSGVNCKLTRIRQLVETGN